MKDKKNLIVVVIIAVLLIGAYMYYKPSDISVGDDTTQTITNEDGTTTTSNTGWFLRLFDREGNEIEIPPEFMIVKDSGLFTIWTTEFPIDCTSDANCPGATTCWNNECVIRDVASMSLGFSVTSSASDITYTNLHISSATPTEWSTALGTPSYTLTPLATQVFTSSVFSIPSAWEGATKTFSVTVEGTSDYDLSTVPDTKSITYKFYGDPAGGFQITISNPFA